MSSRLTPRKKQRSPAATSGTPALKWSTPMSTPGGTPKPRNSPKRSMGVGVASVKAVRELDETKTLDETKKLDETKTLDETKKLDETTTLNETKKLDENPKENKDAKGTEPRASDAEIAFTIVPSARTQLQPTASVVCPRDFPHLCGTNMCSKSAAGCGVPSELVDAFGSAPLVANAMPMFTDVLQDVKFVNVLKPEQKNSSSISVIAFAEHVVTKQPVVIKGFLKQQVTPGRMIFAQTQARITEVNMNFLKLTYEAKMYRALSELGAVPNLVQFIAYQSMPINQDQIRQYMRSRSRARGVSWFMASLNTLVLDPFEPVSLHMIVTEHRPHTVSLNTAVESASMTPNRLRAIMFQIIYTLTVLNATGFQHNDLHPGNIMVDLAPTESSIQYSVFGQQFVVPVSGNKVLLFDWDFGVCPSCGYNSYLITTCASLGICNHINPRFDLFTIMSIMEINSTLTSYADYRKFRNDVIGNTPIAQNHKARMCNPDGDKVFPNGNPFCKPFGTGEPQSVMHPRQALLHEYFNPLRQMQ